MKLIIKIIIISITVVSTTGCVSKGGRSAGFLDAMTAVSPILSLVPGGSNITSAILAAKSVSDLVNSDANPISTIASVTGIPGVTLVMNDPATKALTLGVQTAKNLSRIEQNNKQQIGAKQKNTKNKLNQAVHKRKCIPINEVITEIRTGKRWRRVCRGGKLVLIPSFGNGNTARTSGYVDSRASRSYSKNGNSSTDEYHSSGRSPNLHITKNPDGSNKVTISSVTGQGTWSNPIKHGTGGQAIMYMANGVMHRNDGTALISGDGIQFWYYKGQIHRSGGRPAVIYPNGNTQHYLPPKPINI